jgi:hypothetical protein
MGGGGEDWRRLETVHGRVGLVVWLSRGICVERQRRDDLPAGRTVAPGTWMVSASFAETEATEAAALEGAPAPARGYAGERYGPSACGLQLCL